ncbi:UTRA domain-containing protein [Chromohalobacter canadensis]|uniref:UTRA domain-containing protein n=1 Tax=Chromohalobacter canadensis TaxID=141389 RepID=A0ABZ0Y723_9GAMM|nr:UTRA domain-containing protein [Chromohalobacter canadensis]MCK0768992.1 UTRA domain-containing protein [Chromohalobacter canadensis]WQH07857.1 UTRA domain-containing protein [Chromohalobacter canadensis]
MSAPRTQPIALECHHSTPGSVSTPTWHRLRDALLALIDSLGNNRKRPCRLPAEREMIARFSTTRITLRDALTQLEGEGRIYRENRRGWFIAPSRLHYDLLAGLAFHDMVESQQRQASTLLLSASTVPAPLHIARRLWLSEGSAVQRIVRVRAIDGRRVLYVEHHLRPDCFPGILDFDLAQHSLTALYRHEYAIRIARVDYELGSTIFGGPAGEALHATPGTAAQRITRINRDQNGRVVDCDDEYWRHDAIELALSAVPRGG